MILRRLLSASASGLAFLALSAGPASADPVSTFIIGAIGLTGTAAAVAGFVIKTALWAGASHLISKVLGPRKQGAQARQADIASLSIGEVPREIIVGRAVTGGSLVQGFNWGGANGTDNETLVIALADELCDGLEGVLVDDQFIAHTGDGNVTGTGGGLNIRWRNGATGQTFPADLRTMAGFTAADRLAGVAHVWVTYTAKWAQERGGRPRLRFRVRGGRRYDPRKDSTVPGGSGTHRWNTPSTWEWTENLILNRYAYQRGVFCEGRVTEPEQLWVGRGLSAVEAPPERIIAWANLCDEAVALKGGGSEPRWRVGGVIRADETYIEVDEKFAAACGGTIIQPEGGIEVEPGHGKAAVVHITDDDLMAGEPVQFSEFLPETERFNTVVTRYVDPAQDWQFHSAPVRRSTADITADGGPYTLPVDLELVTSGTQAQRVGEIMRRKARLENRATIPLGPRFSWLEAGDWVVWTSARWLRGATKTFRITADPLDEGWRMKAALEEMQSAVFGWTAASDEITPQTAPPDLWSKPGPIALTGVGVAVIDRNGIPGLRFTWATPVDPAITSVTVEVRVKGEAQSTVSLTREPNSGQLDMTDGVAPETLMEARAWPAGAPDRDIQPSPWVEIGAGILRAGESQTPRPYAADTIKSTFSSLTGLTAVNAAIATVGSGHSVSFTPSGAGSTTYLQWALARPGGRAHRVRLRIRAVGADITAAMWDGRMTYSTPSLGHSLTAGRFASIPFPAGGLPAGQWRDIEFQADGLTDYLDSTINQLRFYLVKPTSGRIDVGRIEAGYAGGATEGARAGTDLFRTDGVTPMTQAEVRTPEGIASGIAGQGAFATSPLPTSRLTFLTDAGDLTSLSRVATRDLNLLTGRTANFLDYTGGGTVDSLRPAAAGADPTGLNISAGFTGQGALATLSEASWGSHIGGRPTELIDGRIGAGLNASGDLNRNILTTRANASNLLRYNAGGLFTGELAADVTGAHVAAGIFGQGALATRNTALASQVQIQLGPNLWRDADLEDPASWTGVFTLELDTRGVGASRNRLVVPSSPSDRNVYSVMMPVRPGSYVKAFTADQPTSSDHSGQFTYLQWFNDDATYSGSQWFYSQTAAGQTGRREQSGVIQVPAGVTRTRFRQRRLAGGSATFYHDSHALKELATLGDSVVRETGILLTDALAVTGLGISAGFTGQGALATLNAASWGSHVSDRPAELTDGRVAAGLNASGDLNRNITTGRANSSNLLRRSSGGLFTGDLAADVTAGNVAAGIAGQGTLATKSSVAEADLGSSAVSTVKIAANAVTDPVRAFTAGSISLDNTNEVIIQSVVRAHTGGDLQLRAVADVFVGFHTISSQALFMRFYHGSTLIKAFKIQPNVVPGGTNRYFDDTYERTADLLGLAADTYTFSVTLALESNAGGTTQTVANRDLLVRETKR